MVAPKRQLDPLLVEMLEPRLHLSTTLVDFGDAVENNTFGTGWATVYKGPYTGYSANGPDGITGSSSGNYHCAGISGAAARDFGVGDQVVVTWYNNAATSKTFTPKISFDDTDYEGTGDTGTWYTMSQMTIPAGQTMSATFTFDAGSAGSYYNVTTSRSTNNVSDTLIDKIEYIPAEPETVLAVDFGDVAGNNQFGISGWDTVYLGQYTGYSSDGPDGIIGSWTANYHTMGVSGPSMALAAGDVVSVTWYNRGASAITFTPYVSFNDPDMKDGGAAGTWYAMSQVTVPAGQTAVTTYTVDSGSAGNYTTIKANRGLNGATDLLCDKIELTAEGGQQQQFTVSITATDASAAEPSNTGTFTVTRSGGTSGNLTVSYSISGTATNGSDYSSLSGSVVIPDGQASATITVTPIDDATVESTETVILTVTSGGYTVGSPSSATVNIADNDNSTFVLSVGNGSGDGSYSQGTQVGVSAESAPQGYMFDRWIGDTGGLASVTSASTTYTMPASAASIVATYMPSSGVVVSTVTGTASTGNTLTISGLNFGSKATAAPVKFDNFDSGTSGTDLQGWVLSKSSGVYPQYSNVRTHSGSLAGLSDFTNQYGCGANVSNLGLTTAYMSYWVYWEHLSGDVSRNIKFGRFSHGLPGDNVHGNPIIGYTQLYETTPQWYSWPDPEGLNVTHWSDPITANGWHRVEQYVEMSTIDTADGVVGFWLDGELVFFDDSIVTYSSSSDGGVINNAWMPFYSAHDPGGAYKIYYDDAYIDSSRARVEIGNAPTWDACTQRDPQPATSWSGNSIQFTAQLGAYSSGTVYVYVVDENGNVNQDGYAVTIGQSSATNRAPAVDAGTAQTIAYGNNASLDGTAKDDFLPASPGTMSYTWSKAAGNGNVTFGNANAIDTTASFSAEGMYTLKLSVSDGNQTRVDYVDVYVTDANNRLTVVNLGSSAPSNVYGFPGWDDIYLGSYVGYSASGPAGTKGGSTGTYDVVAVSGMTWDWEIGQKVVATWYNDSGSQITFTPKVSFTDPDMYNMGTSGTWYDMTQVTIPAYGTATSSYTVGAGSAGLYGLLNVCRGQNVYSAALLDQIELELVV